MFSDEIKFLYQEMILDHGRSPRCFGELNPADKTMRGFNPVCGDQLTVYLKKDSSGKLKVGFTGHGCAISIAATSLLLEAVQNMEQKVALKLIDEFRDMLKGSIDPDEELLGKLVVLSGVKAYPSRIKCATLGCHALKLALTEVEVELATTEL
mgnify:CR=1 FL=1